VTCGVLAWTILAMRLLKSINVTPLRFNKRIHLVFGAPMNVLQKTFDFARGCNSNQKQQVTTPRLNELML
jgi:hypothetical protein